MELSEDLDVNAVVVLMPVLLPEFPPTVDQGTVTAAIDSRNSCPEVELGGILISVDVRLGQDVVDMDVDSLVENEDAVFIMTD